MKKLSLCLMAVMLLTASVSFAQRNYVPGTIITLQKDSVKGFIDDRHWFISPTEVHFKKSLTDENEILYKPGEIESFRVANDREDMYVGRKVLLDVTNQALQALGGQQTQRVVQDTPVFILRVQPGVYTLYQYTDIHSRQHFIYEGAGLPATELRWIKSYVLVQEELRYYESKEYQDQLSVLFADRPDVAKRTASLSYREKEMAKIFVAYNNMKDPAHQEIVKNKVHEKPSFGVLAGFSANSYHFTGPNVIFMKSSYKSTNSPLAGIFLEIPFLHNFSLNNELLYKQIKADGTSYGYSFYGLSAYNDHLDFNYLQLSTLFRYTYQKGRVRPFVTLGFTNALIVKTVRCDIISEAPGDDHTPVKAMNDGGPRSHEEAVVGGLGIKVGHFHLEGRYSSSDGFSPYTNNRTNIRSLQLVAGYHF